VENARLAEHEAHKISEAFLSPNIVGEKPAGRLPATRTDRVTQAIPDLWRIPTALSAPLKKASRSRHLPASIVVHANEIQRLVSGAPIRLFEYAHASAAGNCDSRTRLFPLSRGRDANE